MDEETDSVVQLADALFLNVGFWNVLEISKRSSVDATKGLLWGWRSAEPEVTRPASRVQSSFNRLCDAGKGQRLGVPMYNFTVP